MRKTDELIVGKLDKLLVICQSLQSMIVHKRMSNLPFEGLSTTFEGLTNVYCQDKFGDDHAVC